MCFLETPHNQGKAQHHDLLKQHCCQILGSQCPPCTHLSISYFVPLIPNSRQSRKNSRPLIQQHSRHCCLGRIWKNMSALLQTPQGLSLLFKTPGDLNGISQRAHKNSLKNFKISKIFIFIPRTQKHIPKFFIPRGYLYIHTTQGVHIKAIKNFYNIILFFNLTIDIRLYCLTYIKKLS